MSIIEYPVLEAKDVQVLYRVGSFPSTTVTAVTGANFRLFPGRGIAVVGPSGSGKTSLALACAGLLLPAYGDVYQNGTAVYRGGLFSRRPRPAIQMVFQNPFAALNPRRKIGGWLSLILERRRSTGNGAEMSVDDFLALLGLGHQHIGALPSELSGGECQRVCIAASLAAGAKALILDEPVSMLDPLAREEVVTCLERLQDEKTLAYLLLTHDLLTVPRLCDEIIVLSEGRAVESGLVKAIFKKPQHPITRALLGMG